MNSIKPLAIVAVLAAVAVGLYLKINNMPEPQPPPDISGNWGNPPAIDMGGVDSSMGGMVLPTPGAGSGTKSAGGTAPAFTPSAAGPPAAGVAAPHVEPPAQTGAPAAAGAAGGSAPVFDPQDPAIGGQIASAAAGANASAPAHVHDPFRDVASPGISAKAAAASPHNDPQHDVQPSRLFAAPTHRTIDEAWAEATRLLQANKLSDAHGLLSAWYGNPTLQPEEQRELVEILSGLAGTVIYSQEHWLEPPYYVRAGETLPKIAARYHVPPELLAKINRIRDPHRLEPGQELKVVRGPFSAVVEMERREMVLVLAGRYAGRFPVDIGRDRTDVEGSYEVHSKELNPAYFGADRQIEAGAPTNPLGDRLIGLVNPTVNGFSLPFGIHGSPDGQNIYAHDPRGYVRLRAADAADAYDILSPGSRVTIRR